MDQFGQKCEAYGQQVEGFPDKTLQPPQKSKRRYTKRLKVETPVETKDHFDAIYGRTKRAWRKRHGNENPDPWKRIHGRWINEDRDAAKQKKITSYFRLTKEEIDLTKLINEVTEGVYAEVSDEQPKNKTPC